MRAPLLSMASALAFSILLSACGQKGPLYLPQAPAAPASGAATGAHHHGQPVAARKDQTGETDKTKNQSQQPSEQHTEAEAVTK